MSEPEPISLTPANGHVNVPALTDYDDVSPIWREREFLADTDAHAFIAGAWEGDPGWVRFDAWPYSEICFIQSGRVAVEALDGRRWEYGPGDAFLIPAGFSGVWHTIEPSRKVFVGVP